MSVTYAQLNNALLKLGFGRHEYEGKHYVYINEAHDTLLTFPIVDMATPAWAAHVVTARKMVVEKGITSEDHWNTLLYCASDAKLSAASLTAASEQEVKRRCEEDDRLRKLFSHVPDTAYNLRNQVRDQRELQLVGSR